MANTTADAPVRAIQGRAQAMREADALTAPAFKHDALHGNNPQQVELAFQQIASMANTLRDYLQQNAADDNVCPWLVAIVVGQIGTLADYMSGCDVVGGPVTWAIGGSYEKAGEA